MVTMKDVAQEAKVSVSTVSLVINSRSTLVPLSEVTKDRVMKSVEQLGYRPNIFARSLRTNRSSTFGIMVFDIEDPYCARIIRGIEEAVSKNNYQCLLADVQNDEKKVRNYVELFEDISSFGAIRAISEKGLRVPEDIAVVGFDDVTVSEFYNPPLTTVQQPMLEMGRQAANLLFGLIGQREMDSCPKKIVLEPKLVVRESSGSKLS